ncbi:citrate synthase 2, peroxisomal-like [Hibiscus syriacus]|uniref:citrate synthase 2, peroxisomal-like n=1 Tax=Hibiscus syriacus TaxID=106335 RepID=UPI0019211B21|nr:citrate synthase 2, peroxisomal-like [Hibiscus syriacus]
MSSMEDSKAKARLAVLAAHLAAPDWSSNNPNSSVLEPWCVSAQAAPSSVGGLLTVVDERTGKKYQVPVSHEGTVRATDFKKITTGKDHKGLKIYDPSYFFFIK